MVSFTRNKSVTGKVISQIALLLGLLMSGISCSQVDSNSDEEWRCCDKPIPLWGGTLPCLRCYARDYKHVILVCVYDRTYEARPRPEYNLCYNKATVVRSYKGDWKVSEKIVFVDAIEGDLPSIPADIEHGFLVYVFTDYHRSDPIGVDCGETFIYESETERAMQIIFPRANNRGL